MSFNTQLKPWRVKGSHFDEKLFAAAVLHIFSLFVEQPLEKLRMSDMLQIQKHHQEHM